MLLYLRHSQTVISFATHQCARCTHVPKQSHEGALKQIGRLLKEILKNGLVLTLSNDFKMDCYPDADFAGLWLRDDRQDLHGVRSRTGDVICLANCPVLWKSKLQTEIALSTIEVEYVALSTLCCDLLPLIEITNEICSIFHIGLIVHKRADLHIKIYEDNVGALALGKLELQQITPRLKHYTIKYHWFRENLGPRKIQLVKVSSEKQSGNLFAKGLRSTKFFRLQKKLMGW
jgi:hypothetical protein